MNDVKFWQVKNFSRFQHYKDANKKYHWIKLYHALPDDHEFATLADKDKYLVIGLFLLAGRTGNKIINDPKYIRNILHLRTTPNLKPLVGIWIIPYTESSRSIDKGYAKSTLEIEIEIERENPPCVPPLGEFKNVKLAKDEYSKLIQRFGKADAAERIEHLGCYVKQTGRSYKSHYATILNWSRRDEKVKSTPKYPKKKGDL